MEKLYFKKNKYLKWYWKIINKAKKRKNSIETYLEGHHCIPKSFGGTNYSKNIVNLTPREHFICHLLLTKFTDGYLLSKAYAGFFMMKANIKNRYDNFQSYSKTKERLSRYFKENQHQVGSKNSNFGKKWIKYDFLKIQMLLKQEFINQYLEQGWVLGRNMSYKNINKLKADFDKKLAEKARRNKLLSKSKAKYQNMYNLYLTENFQTWSAFCRYHQINRYSNRRKIKEKLGIFSLKK